MSGGNEVINKNLLICAPGVDVSAKNSWPFLKVPGTRDRFRSHERLPCRNR